MTRRVNDGGPAFPHDVRQQNPGGFAEADPGMSLLDHYAGLAMHADLVYQGLEGREDVAHVAAMAYEMGRAMLVERRKLDVETPKEVDCIDWLGGLALRENLFVAVSAAGDEWICSILAGSIWDAEKHIREDAEGLGKTREGALRDLAFRLNGKTLTIAMSAPGGGTSHRDIALPRIAACRR